MEIPLCFFDGSAAARIYNSGTPDAIRARMRGPDSVREVIMQSVEAARRGEGPFINMSDVDLKRLLNVAEIMGRREGS